MGRSSGHPLLAYTFNASSLHQFHSFALLDFRTLPNYCSSLAHLNQKGDLYTLQGM